MTSTDVVHAARQEAERRLDIPAERMGHEETNGFVKGAVWQAAQPVVVSAEQVQALRAEGAREALLAAADEIASEGLGYMTPGDVVSGLRYRARTAQPVVVSDDLRSAISTWLTLALDFGSDGPTTADLLALREWIDDGCSGPMPEPVGP